MGTVWVYKLDGTLQCDQGLEISLEEMQKQLESIGARVLQAKKQMSCNLFASVCGAPTGMANTYEISTEDWERIRRGFVGLLGFDLWPCESNPPSSKGRASASADPVLVRELIGREVRVYEVGDGLTDDYRRMRVNIELKDGTISDIWYG